MTGGVDSEVGQVLCRNLPPSDGGRCGGLGREHALLLASRGARILINDLGGATDGTADVSAAQNVVSEINALGSEAMANGASVTDYAEVDAMVADAVARWGRVVDVITWHCRSVPQADGGLLW